LPELFTIMSGASAASRSAEQHPSAAAAVLQPSRFIEHAAENESEHFRCAALIDRPAHAVTSRAAPARAR